MMNSSILLLAENWVMNSDLSLKSGRWYAHDRALLEGTLQKLRIREEKALVKMDVRAPAPDNSLTSAT